VNVATQFPSLRELLAVKMTLLRSTVLGTLLGIVPGAGATITSFISYGIEKQYGRRRHLLGTGIPEGIVAPQIGATASVAGHMIPLLTLGLPGSGATAVILAAFLLHGVQPGPMLLGDPASSLMVYTILASMFASVIGMCLVGFFWIRVVVKVLTVPQGVLSAIVVMFCLVGAYANRNDMSDVWMIVIFGVLGYLFDKFKFPISPMVLGAILGPIGETAFMRSMISSGGDWTVFFRGPICGTLMAGSLLALSYPLLREFLAVRRRTAAVAIPGEHR
jgi:putative tricarboxylic transport membrane protein